MNNDNNQSKMSDSAINSDERRGLNEDADFENAKNDYQNNEPVLDVNKDEGNTISNDVDDDIRALENGPQKHPGSNGAFPVGAFDTSRE